MSSRKKVVKQKETVQNIKRPVNIENPEGYLKKHPVWAFQHCDLEHERWSVKNCRSFYTDILDKLISYERLTWAEELYLDVDQLFSLRLTARERLYGILNNGVFYVLWYDPCHEIYESKI